MSIMRKATAFKGLHKIDQNFEQNSKIKIAFWAQLQGYSTQAMKIE